MYYTCTAVGNLLYHTWYLCLCLGFGPPGIKGFLGMGKKERGSRGMKR